MNTEVLHQVFDNLEFTQTWEWNGSHPCKENEDAGQPS